MFGMALKESVHYKIVAKEERLVKLKNFISMALTVVFVFTSVGCFAVDMDVSMDSEFSLSIGLDLGRNEANKQIAVEILKANKDYSDIISNDSDVLRSVFETVNQYKADSSGKISFKISPVTTGRHSVFVKGEKSLLSEEKSFWFANKESFDLTLLGYQDAVLQDVADLFAGKGQDNSDYMLLNLNYTTADELLSDTSLCTQAVKDKINQRVLGKINAVTTQTQTHDMIDEIVLTEVFYGIRSSSAMKEYLQAHETELGLSASDIYKELYIAGTSDEKEKILNAFCTYSWKTGDAADLVKKAEGIILLTAYKDALYSDAVALTDTWKDALMVRGLNYTAFNALGNNKSEVFIQIADSSADELEAYIEIINSKVTQLSTGGDAPVVTPSYPGGGGGGGGSSRKETVEGITAPVSPPAQMLEKKTHGFTDLLGVKWAEDAISYLKERGIIAGKTSTEFMPADDITREEFVKMIVLALEIYDENAQVDFDDVASSDWFSSYVASAVKNHIVSGYDNKFAVGQRITREDMAVMVYRGLKDLNQVSESLFADDGDISEYARDAVYALVNSGVVKGMGDNHFAPKATATRAQASVIIYNLMMHLQGEGAE